MTPLGHASIAFLTGVTIIKILPINVDPVMGISAITVGGIFPDIDLFYRFYQKGKAVFDKSIGKHRFFPSHTPLAMFLLSLPVMVFSWRIGLIFFIGTLIHLLLDTLFFPEGINFTYPINRQMTYLFTIKTHKFWAPKEVSGVKNWHKNYLSSPLFWIFEALPAAVAIVVLLRLI